jgi:hypothetical protein
MKSNIKASRIVELVFTFLIVCGLLALITGILPYTYKGYIIISLVVNSIGLAAFKLLPLWFQFEDKNNASKPYPD